ncbi:MAG: type III secretion system stator protein SctL [Acidobacteriia bacterium]|nr:type III secretion system stator protein SctL [Terriglobia bacterium]
MEEKIIKARLDAEGRGMTLPKVIKKDVYDAGIDAQRIVERAQQQAEAILAEAARRGEEAAAAARQRGYQDGLEQWAAALDSVARANQALNARYEGELVKLAVRIAEKIIGEELRARPETVVSIVREALRSVGNEQHLTVQVNPGESQQVAGMLDRLREVVKAGHDIQIVADPAIAPGGCIVHSDMGAVDARLETQLRRLEEILLRVAGKK